VCIFFLLAVFLTGCTSRKPGLTTPELEAHRSILEEADRLYHAGSLNCLRQALRLYEQALSYPVPREKTRAKLLKTAILLDLRKKELGISDEGAFRKAADLIASSPSLSGFGFFLDIAASVPIHTPGIMGDPRPGSESPIARWDVLKKNLASWVSLLEESARKEAFYAYLAITFHSRFSFFISHELQAELDANALKTAYSREPIIRYRLALFPREDPEALEELLSMEPGFVEAHYFLGRVEFQRGRLLAAEEHFLKVLESIPESTAATLCLASVAFALEELERSLDFYRRVLERIPEYREAMLGEAMCLSYLGRHQEALEVLGRMLSLGKYYLGETHYWLAWNLKELGELEKAREHIRNSKKYMIGQSEVHALAGIIAYEMQQLDEAEEELKQAARLDAANTEAHYFLGKTYSALQEWEAAGISYECASTCYEKNEQAVREKIQEISASSLSENRKKRCLDRKKAQLEKILLSKATSWYNAAAGYYNAGLREKARRLARRASSHPTLRQKALELLTLLEEHRTPSHM